MDIENAANAAPRPRRSIFMRVLFGLLWILPVRFSINFFIGAVVGFMAGFAAGSPEAGRAAGQAAALSFFMSYGLIVLLAELIVTALLACLDILPGTGKFKSMV